MNTFLARAADWVGPATPTLLLDLTLKGAAILLLALIATRLMSARSASARHHVWTLAFVLVLALPLLSAVVPGWRIEIAGWPAVASAGGSTTATAMDRPARSGEETAMATPETALERLEAGAPARSAPGARPADETSSGSPGEGTLPGPAGIFLALWLVGAGLLLARLAVGIVSAWWTARGAIPLDDPEWTSLLSRLRREIDVTRPVRLVESAAVATPMAWGVLHPTILVPDTAHGWSENRRRAVLLHELGHVKRGDCPVHLLAQAARAVHWLTPLAWIGTRRLHAERERACDDLVLTAGTRGADYARLLLDVARGRRGRAPTFAAVSMARPSELEGRLLAVLDESRDRRGLSPAASLAWSLAAIALVLPLAALQAVPAPAASDAPTPAVASHAEPPAPAPRPGARAHALARASGPGPRASRGDDADVPRVLERDDSAGDPPVTLTEDLPAIAAPLVADTLEERVREAFLRALESERPSLRAQAAHALGMAESPLAVAPLARRLADDESAAVRAEAAWALGMIESDEAVDVLSRAVRDEDGEVRSQAVWALGMIESPEAVDGLLVALEDSTAAVREQAAWALGMIEDARATEALMRVLASDANAGARSQAAWALGMIEDARAMDVLIDALEDEDDGVAEQAMWALGRVMR